MRGLLFGAGVFLAVALVAVVVALVQRGNARGEALRSDAQRLGTLAGTETSLDRSFLFAVAGRHLSDRAETRGDLLGVLQHSPAVFRLIHPSRHQITALAVSPDGRLLATGDSAGIVRFHNIRTWQGTGRVIRLGGAVSQQAMAFSPNGDTLAVATAGGATGRACIWSSCRRARCNGSASWPSIPASIGPARFTRMAFSPDGTRLAVAVATAAPDSPVPVGQRLILLDASSGQLIWQRSYPMRPFQGEASVAFTAPRSPRDLGGAGRHAPLGQQDRTDPAPIPDRWPLRRRARRGVGRRGSEQSEPGRSELLSGCSGPTHRPTPFASPAARPRVDHLGRLHPGWRRHRLRLVRGDAERCGTLPPARSWRASPDRPQGSTRPSYPTGALSCPRPRTEAWLRGTSPGRGAWARPSTGTRRTWVVPPAHAS